MGAAEDAFEALKARFAREVRSEDHREANGQFVWDVIWRQNNLPRFRRMMKVYRTIVERAGAGESRRAVDFGGGPGALASGLNRRGWAADVVDISAVAAFMCGKASINCIQLDLEDATLADLDGVLAGAELVTGTEFLEHLSEDARQRLLASCGGFRSLWSVPNDCLGPDVEPQHTVQWAPDEFRAYLEGFYPKVEVVELGRYMLADCTP